MMDFFICTGFGDPYIYLFNTVMTHEWVITLPKGVPP